MRLLMDPIYTHWDLTKCATFYAFKQIADAFVTERPDAVVYLPVPRNTEWKVPGAWDPRIHLIPVEHWRDRYKEYVILREEWAEQFSSWGRYWDWDLCVTVRPALIPNMRMLGDRLRKAFLIFDPLPLVSGKVTVRGSIEHCLEWEGQTVTGYASADAGVVNAPHERGFVLDTARRYLSASRTIEVDRHTHAKFMVPSGVNPDYGRQQTRADVFPRTIVYPQRLDATERRPAEAFHIFALARGMGSGARFTCCSNSATLHGFDKEYGHFVEFAQPPREEFYARLKATHVFLSWAIEEGIPLGLVEATCLGVIGVVPRAPWALGMFGREYPFLAKSHEDAAAALTYVVTAYEEAWEKWAAWYDSWWRPWLDRHGDFVRWFLAWCRGWDENRKEDTFKRKPNPLSVQLSGAGELAGGEIDIGEMLTPLDRAGVLHGLKQSMMMGEHFDVPRMRTLSLTRVRQDLIYRHGWKDAPQVGVLVRA